jgi:hypothetical protein
VSHLGVVSSESGPLLLVDVRLLEHWGGTATGDYERVCQQLDERPQVPGLEVDVGGGTAVVWELSGGGSADVFRRANELLLCRSWADDDEAARRVAQAPPASPTRIGSLAVDSGWLLALWATGSADEIELPPSLADGQAVEVAGVADAGLVASLVPGRYDAWCDEIEHPDGAARRCWLVPAGTMPARGAAVVRGG